MGGKKGGHDQKVASQAAKDAKSAAERENDAQADWSKGANNKGASKAEAAAAKADELARKKKEKADLLAEEEANLGPGGKVAKKVPTLSKNKGGKKKKNNDLSFLEDALVSGAEKKVKAKKKADLAKAEKLKAIQLQTKKKDEEPMDPLLANTEGMIGATSNDLVGRAANKALDEENAASGIDGALDSLHVSAGTGGTSIHNSTKGLFKAYEARMMSEIKEDYPGLKLSQIKEKIFQKWKKSPENPANQQQ
ncbi:hypothetical protein FRACYDRAFT_268954 [Fragilariopsis cylindrus CCMP1102]|uniref:Uncharacterized protein n=1 Tax=Fragilariopsis cylindrus CCMP1102 TaxID=635003 RepID=A0A1E7FDS5_9STRA|nr:hypothetical protein FRACYDRAFT_268954 [Fragilariopsis cylindrus CCMP1102]|eukprot:OEU16299.1 hypothetical protein FRACYDRAFT_268954 [Fragilariopsis cylindrus CCMP1102]